MQEIIDALAAFGLFSLIVIAGTAGLFLKTMYSIDRQSKRVQPTVKQPLYEREAEAIILQLL